MILNSSRFSFQIVKKALNVNVYLIVSAQPLLLNFDLF